MTEKLKYVQTSRLEIAYEEKGDRKNLPIILVHGFPDDVRTWDAVVSALVEAGYRTLTPYLRGFGRSRFLHEETPRSGQLTALGQDVIDFANALGIGKFILVGHDWGDGAGSVVSVASPDRVRALLAISAGYGTNNPGEVISSATARA